MSVKSVLLALVDKLTPSATAHLTSIVTNAMASGNSSRYLRRLAIASASKTATLETVKQTLKAKKSLAKRSKPREQNQD